MKNQLSAICLLCLVFMLATGCSNNSAQPGHNNPETEQNPAAEPGDEIDLTILSSTMLSAELNNIRTNLDKYLGKTIKISGGFSAFYFEETDKLYSYVITYMDPTNCCSEGMEFTWNGDHQYPGDYPAEGAGIEVTGVLNSYEESGGLYCYLAVEDIAVLD